MRFSASGKWLESLSRSSTDWHDNNGTGVWKKVPYSVSSVAYIPLPVSYD